MYIELMTDILHEAQVKLDPRYGIAWNFGDQYLKSGKVMELTDALPLDTKLELGRILLNTIEPYQHEE